jgi:hypothetical protein
MASQRLIMTKRSVKNNATIACNAVFEETSQPRSPITQTNLVQNIAKNQDITEAGGNY